MRKIKVDPRAVARFLAPVVACALVCGIVGTNLDASRATAVSDAESRVSAAKQAVSDAQRKHDRAQLDSVAKAADIDAPRVASDTELIESVMREATTWKDSSTYGAARDRIVQTYHVDEGTQLLTSFMKTVEKWTDEDGNERNSVDDSGASTTFSSAETSCRRNDDGTYSYVCVATATSTSGSETVDTRYFASVTTTDGGKVTSFDVTRAYDN